MNRSRLLFMTVQQIVYVAVELTHRDRLSHESARCDLHRHTAQSHVMSYVSSHVRYMTYMCICSHRKLWHNLSRMSFDWESHSQVMSEIWHNIGSSYIRYIWHHLRVKLQHGVSRMMWLLLGGYDPTWPELGPYGLSNGSSHDIWHNLSGMSIESIDIRIKVISYIYHRTCSVS